MFNTYAFVCFDSFEDRSSGIPGAKRWPIRPDDILNNGCSMHVTIPPSCVADGADESIKTGFFGVFTPSNPEELCMCVLDTYSNMRRVGVDFVCSVHPKNILLPILSWAFLRQPDKSRSDVLKPYAASITIDLCEEFYSPTPLNYDTRKAFSPDTLRKWLGIANNLSDTATLVELWKRMA